MGSFILTIFFTICFTIVLFFDGSSSLSFGSFFSTTNSKPKDVRRANALAFFVGLFYVVIVDCVFDGPSQLSEAFEGLFTI